MNWKMIVTAALMVALAACQTVKPPSTASGRPEVMVNGGKAESVKALLLSKTLDKGWRLTKDDMHNLTFEKPTDSLAANILFSSKAGGLPMLRINFTLAELPAGTRVVADMAIITNPGMAFEQRTDVSQGAEAPKVQAFLDQVAEEATPKGKKVASR